MNNILGERDGLRVVFDDRRGYARLDPLQSQAEIDRLYAGSFWADKADLSTGRSEQAVRRLQAEWWDLHYGDWLELAREAAHFNIHNVLDVGCGFGYWMRHCLREGIDVTGVDVNPDAIREACAVLGEACGAPVDPSAPVLKTSGVLASQNRPWRLARTTLVNAPLRESLEPYEMVSALWVMEHLADPHGFLVQVRNMLYTGGIFVVAVPSDFNALQLKVVDEGLSARPYWWIDPTHLNYWTPATFANLLGRHGFRVAALTTMYPMERFILDGEQDYPADSTLGPTLHAEVRAEDAEMEREERIDYYRHLALGGQGREIIAVCIKE